MDPAGADLKKEEHMQRLEEQRLDGEAVARQHGVAMPGQELPPGAGAPAAQRRRRDVAALEDIADRRAADGVAELGQLALEPPVAPARVLTRQPQEQRLHCGIQPRTAADLAPSVGPFPAHELAMPAQHGRWLDQEHRTGQPRPWPGEQTGELGGQDGKGQLLPARQAESARRPALQQADLMPQQRDF